MQKLWAEAQKIDPTLKATPRELKALRRRRLQAVPFSREALFGAMAPGEPILFSDFPVPVRGERRSGVRDAVLRALCTGLPQDQKIRVRCGASGTKKYISRDDLLRRWQARRGRVNVTDLHIRGTQVVRSIDCSNLSDFNLLARAPGEAGREEMLTIVMSSAGTFTDSHSDDPDGSNHCFAGKKLWLAWDTFRGLSLNLQDVERTKVAGQAAFSISAFLSIRGARWFTVETGQTLFLPGHLTHKVVTLEEYIGVGSFFVMLPSYLRTVHRWTVHTPLWALTLPHDQRLKLVDEITSSVTAKVRALRRAAASERQRWGVAYLSSAIARWARQDACSKSILLDRAASAAFIQAALADTRHTGGG